MRAVFLHAFGADRLSWAGTTPSLPDIECATPDLPGHGSKINDLDDGSLTDLADRVTVDIGDERSWLVGHSLGGSIALQVATQSPEQCEGLILLCPLGLGSTANLERVISYPGIASKDEMRFFLEWLVVKTAIIADQFVDYGFDQLEIPGARDALAKIAGNLSKIADETRSSLAAIEEAKIDVTIVWGADDPICVPDRDLIRPHWDLHVLPEVGHIPHVEAMKDVNALLRSKLVP
ncbi:MAG: alpha/beta fold hydrolase [Pseudomonadota bacterium]